MHTLDWQSAPAPDHVQQARMYVVAETEIGGEHGPDETAEISFDPATGVFYARMGNKWESTIQQFPHGEVKNK